MMAVPAGVGVLFAGLAYSGSIALEVLLRRNLLHKLSTFATLFDAGPGKDTSGLAIVRATRSDGLVAVDAALVWCAITYVGARLSMIHVGLVGGILSNVAWPVGLGGDLRRADGWHRAARRARRFDCGAAAGASGDRCRVRGGAARGEQHPLSMGTNRDRGRYRRSCCSSTTRCSSRCFERSSADALRRRSERSDCGGRTTRCSSCSGRSAPPDRGLRFSSGAFCWRRPSVASRQVCAAAIGGSPQRSIDLLPSLPAPLAFRLISPSGLDPELFEIILYSSGRSRTSSSRAWYFAMICSFSQIAGLSSGRISGMYSCSSSARCGSSPTTGSPAPASSGNPSPVSATIFAAVDALRCASIRRRHRHCVRPVVPRNRWPCSTDSKEYHARGMFQDRCRRCRRIPPLCRFSLLGIDSAAASLPQLRCHPIPWDLRFCFRNGAFRAPDGKVARSRGSPTF